jgi:hypothetical protein
MEGRKDRQTDGDYFYIPRSLSAGDKTYLNDEQGKGHNYTKLKKARNTCKVNFFSKL